MKSAKWLILLVVLAAPCSYADEIQLKQQSVFYSIQN